MSNDYSDLTDMLNEVLERYNINRRVDMTDLDSWDTDDLRIMQEIFVQALELRLDDGELDRMREMASREEDESSLHTLEEYINCEFEHDDTSTDIEAEYEDPLFVG